ncbi:MAG TPA: ribonuclease P protein component [Candidatus Paceibacterota bacterium]|nr:ribonuclease P protein component [Candidatus Paceibacterota bacterium]
MIPSRRRLRADEVREVLSRGSTRRAGPFSLKYLETTTVFRCAVVVSKKVAKTAVMRNRLRRAGYRALGAASLPPTGHAILFVQSIPPGDLATAFSSNLKTLLHV